MKKEPPPDRERLKLVHREERQRLYGSLLPDSVRQRICPDGRIT